ncbi:ParB/RepB/Spo0J family partition protein [Bacillus sp. Gen3]|nr:ParB/RepB/Spo0J family partition protein [Bacillus sp. Gen3]
MNQLKIALDQIIRNENQPRKIFNEESIAELAESIKKDGLQSPIMVRPLNGKYEIVQGERRYRAAQVVGLSEIDAFVKELSDEDAFHLAVIENIQREQLTPIEEARAFLWYSHKGLTQEEIAQKVKKTRDYVASKLRLLSLSDSVQAMIERGDIKEGHAKQLLRLKNILERLCTETYAPVMPKRSLFELFQDKFTRHFWDKEPITVNDVKKWVDEWHFLLVFSTIRQSIGFESAAICIKSNETKLPINLSVGNVCFLYGCHINNITDSDIDFAIDFEQGLLKHSYDKEFRKWNIEKFYDSVRFKENPISNETLEWVNPSHYVFVMLTDSARSGERDGDGFLIIKDDEDLYRRLVDEFNSEHDFRQEFGVVLFGFYTNHSTLEIDPQRIKEFYLWQDFMKERGFKDFYESMKITDEKLESDYRSTLNLRLLIEQVYKLNDEEGQERMSEIDLAKMLIINFREDTGQTVDIDTAIGSVRKALELDISQEEVRKLLDEADVEQ